MQTGPLFGADARLKLIARSALGLSLITLLALLAFLRGASGQNHPFGPWFRASETPILSPQGSTWESAGTFNPAVVVHHGKFVMLYRAQDAAGTSRLGYGESTDGIHFTRRPEPALSPEADYQTAGGGADPPLQ